MGAQRLHTKTTAKEGGKERVRLLNILPKEVAEYNNSYPRKEERERERERERETAFS